MNKISLLFTLCVLCGFVSCGGGDKPVDPPKPQEEVDLPKPVLNLNFSGIGTVTTSFTTNVSWSITLSDTKAVPTWFTVDKMSGAAGSHMLTLTVTQANPSTTESRNGYVFITAGQLKATMTIVQPKSEGTNVAVTGVSLSKTSTSLIVGATEKLSATITPENATNKNLTWSSSNGAVATVSASGEVNAIAEGSAKITVTTIDGAKTATCEVTVATVAVAVTGVSLSKTSTSLIVGATEKLSATITPENATNKNLTWSSSNGAVATVSASGEVNAIAEGSAKITVATIDGAKTATCEVTVATVDLISIDVMQNDVESSAGEFSVQLTANRQWGASGVSQWLTLDPVSGNGNATVKVKYNQNSDQNQRVASIVFTAGSATKTLTVTQKVSQLNDLEPEEL